MTVSSYHRIFGESVWTTCARIDANGHLHWWIDLAGDWHCVNAPS